MKYLLIFEDGSQWTVDEISDDDTAAVDDGLMDIFKFEDGKFLIYHGEGVWDDVPVPSKYS